MTVETGELVLPDALPIPGLRFRRLRLPHDLGPVVALINAANEADQIEDRSDVESQAQWYATASGWDPLTDCILAEVDGELIAYGRARWENDNDGGRNYNTWGAVHPGWRRRGLGRAILHANMRRLREMAAGHDLAPAVERRFETWTGEAQVGAQALLESEEFTVARYFFEMLRPNLDDIVAFPLPEGIELRPMLPEHYRAVWDADREAFADHWGGMDWSDLMFQRFFSGPDFEPDLWRVAWDGDQVVGSVSNIVMRGYNAETGANRGLLAGVSVRRPWRGRGLARALVSHSLVALRDRGMIDAVLGVDADNPHGALGVYEANGFAVSRREYSWRRPFGEG